MSSSPAIPRIPLSYDNDDANASALELVLTLKPNWRASKELVELKHFTDGITNTLLKATLKLPGLSESEADQDAVLLRAYGKGTSLIIDRDRECTSHALLAEHNLAPPLLARFENGLLYQYLEGSACAPADLRRPEVWRAVARRLGEWHTVMPVPERQSNGVTNGKSTEPDLGHLPEPNLWSTLNRWIAALPVDTDMQKARQTALGEELKFLIKTLGSTPGIGGHGLVFSHCDLLSGNVIIEPASSASPDSPGQATQGVSSTTKWGESEISVAFIDYEYATPTPAAFDIANHFAEWGGFDCDYSVLPTKSERRDFLQQYVHSYHFYRSKSTNTEAQLNGSVEATIERDIDQLYTEVDSFRGVPGFYWGIWALIQATISQIDFDYASYALVRLDEYWAWKRATYGDEGVNTSKGAESREKRWAEE